jgi:hypothetical protein
VRSVSRREQGCEVVVGRSPLGIGERFPMDTRARGNFILQQLLRYLLEPAQFSFLRHFEDGGEDAALAGVSLNGKYEPLSANCNVIISSILPPVW